MRRCTVHLWNGSGCLSVRLRHWPVCFGTANQFLTFWGGSPLADVIVTVQTRTITGLVLWPPFSLPPSLPLCCFASWLLPASRYHLSETNGGQVVTRFSPFHFFFSRRHAFSPPPATGCVFHLKLFPLASFFLFLFFFLDSIRVWWPCVCVGQ